MTPRLTITRLAPDATVPCDECEDGRVEVLGTVHQWMMSPPYLLVECECCHGTGEIDALCECCDEPAEYRVDRGGRSDYACRECLDAYLPDEVSAWLGLGEPR